MGTLENAALLHMSGAPEAFGAPLVDNLEAQQALREIAGSSAPICTNISLGPLLSMDDTLKLTGRALAGPMAVVDVPDGPRGGAHLGVQPTPVAPMTLLDLFGRCRFRAGRRT